MKASNLLRFRNLMVLFLFMLALDTLDTYAQNQYGTYGTSRRVARRTSRRTTRRTYARQDYMYNQNYYYEDEPAQYSGGSNNSGGGSSVPLSGCKPKTVNNVEYQYCGGKYYRPYFDGTSVVYVEENP